MIESARGSSARSQFFRDAVAEKLAAITLKPVPREIVVSPDRVGKGGPKRRPVRFGNFSGSLNDGATKKEILDAKEISYKNPRHKKLQEPRKKMKTILCTIAAAALLLTGCRQKPESPDVVNDGKITWMDGYTNARVFVSVGNLQTNIPVENLDDALSVANQYGWKFIASEHDRYSEIYRIQRTGKEPSVFSLQAEWHP